VSSAHELLIARKNRALGFDPWQAQQMMQNLSNDFEVLEYRHTVKNMSEPMKELERAVLARQYVHASNKTFDWCMLNTTYRLDEKENIYPIKDAKDSKNKIDAAVAAIMGVGLWVQQEVQKPSVYESRGIRTL